MSTAVMVWQSLDRLGKSWRGRNGEASQAKSWLGSAGAAWSSVSWPVPFWCGAARQARQRAAWFRMSGLGLAGAADRVVSSDRMARQASYGVVRPGKFRHGAAGSARHLLVGQVLFRPGSARPVMAGGWS